MSATNEYSSPRAVLQAITAAAKRHALILNTTVDAMMQMEYRNRFLARVFSSADEWVLKGGTGTLLRLPDARATKDIDLLRQEVLIDAAADELRQAAGQDIGDFFRFTFVRSTPMGNGERAATRDGVRLVFDAYCGQKQLNPIHVDLVVSRRPLIGEIETAVGILADALPNLAHAPIRLYPLVDQIADKVAAMTEVHSGGRPSTRSRDLVDIVTYAATQAFESRPLAQAIAAEMRLRRLPDDNIAGRIPAEDWRARYAVEAARITHCRRHPTISDAVDLVRTFIDDALAETTAAKRWNPDLLEWERSDPTAPPPRRG